MPVTDAELADKRKAETQTACMVLQLIRDQANKLQSGPESICPPTTQSAEALRAGLMSIAGKANAVLTALNYHP